MNRLPLLLFALLFAAPTTTAHDEYRIVEETGPRGSLTVEWTRPDGSTYRTAETRETLERSLVRQRKSARERQERNRRSCEMRLEQLSQSIDQLANIERHSDPGRAGRNCAAEPDAYAQQYCEELARASAKFLPNARSAVQYRRTQAGYSCDASQLGSARPTALPKDLETAARDVLLEAIERLFAGVTQQ